MRVVAHYFIINLVIFVPAFSSETDGCSAHSSNSQDLAMRWMCFEVGPAVHAKVHQERALNGAIA